MSGEWEAMEEEAKEGRRRLKESQRTVQVAHLDQMTSIYFRTFTSIISVSNKHNKNKSKLVLQSHKSCN